MKGGAEIFSVTASAASPFTVAVLCPEGSAEDANAPVPQSLRSHLVHFLSSPAAELNPARGRRTQDGQGSTEEP
ncbi:hypothetical protein AAFF_G00113460 [Aldrovandia affinis]|uniref:Uncharacterized protein n=1 Tax=Aldrovandia affinis TaxID=143900 RepID=A0AAD7WAF7_9TELE|nr:hypothetical protein AAFF_G00113460 [Aldrovandia affinis]